MRPKASKQHALARRGFAAELKSDTAVRKYRIGDTVTITHYTPVKFSPGVKDELGTERLFRSIVGKSFQIRGFDRYGNLELKPTRWDTIWIEPKDVKLQRRRRPPYNKS